MIEIVMVDLELNGKQSWRNKTRMIIYTLLQAEVAPLLSG